jgi:hypothetical protein
MPLSRVPVYFASQIATIATIATSAIVDGITTMNMFAMIVLKRRNGRSKCIVDVTIIHTDNTRRQQWRGPRERCAEVNTKMH